jgi:hypothetical protein
MSISLSNHAQASPKVEGADTAARPGVAPRLFLSRPLPGCLPADRTCAIALDLALGLTCKLHGLCPHGQPEDIRARLALRPVAPRPSCRSCWLTPGCAWL